MSGQTDPTTLGGRHPARGRPSGLQEGQALRSTFCWCPFSPTRCCGAGVGMAGLEAAGPQETRGKARAVPLSHTQQKLRSLQGPTSSVASVSPSLVFSPLGGCIPAAPASLLFSQHVRGAWTSAPLHWGSLRCSHGSVLLLLSSFAQTSSSVGPSLASPFNITMYVSPPHRHKHIRNCPTQLHNYPIAPNTF